MEEKELPTIEKTVYRINGTLMNILSQLEVMNKTLEKSNWNFGKIAQIAQKKD